jgi:ankyrin repeat protein
MASAKQIDKAIAERDIATLLKYIDAGADIDRRDADGNALLHHAARFGDLALAEKLVAKGAKTFTHNNDGETPWDVAASWGHDAVAARLQDALRAEMKAAAEIEKISYTSLQQIRDASAKNGASEFHALASKGLFAQVIALAEKDGGFSAADMLEKGRDGTTVVLKLAQQGSLGSLLKPALWSARPNDFQNVWLNVPKNYRDGHDYDGFISGLRQAKLQSYAKPKLPGLGKPPKL